MAAPPQRLGFELTAADFDYALPPALIAQRPAHRRDQSRLLVLDRASGRVSHERFHTLPHHLRPGDLLVLNDTRVIPARLRGVKTASGGKAEVFLLREQSENIWWTLLRPAKRMRPGDALDMLGTTGRRTRVRALLLQKEPDGRCLFQFQCDGSLRGHLHRLGEVPLPPYIRRDSHFPQRADRGRYQTVFAQHPGSCAAPTAGLHFTSSLLKALTSRGVDHCFVTLHVGHGTFAPMTAPTLAAHRMHRESFDLSARAADAIQRTRQAGRRIVAVGTTTLRVLETVAHQHGGRLVAGSGETEIFIHPPFEFRAVDALITNFHLPQSTLLMLACAFTEPGGTAGRARLLDCYNQAVQREYRFFSYGDAMLIQ